MESITEFLRQSNKRKYAKIKLDTFDAFYNVPVHDNKYIIRETPIIREDKSDSTFTYINQVIKRATSQVDPRKYSKQVDWKK